MSKGSKQRPFDYEAFAANYDRIFGKERKNAKKVEEQEAVVPNVQSVQDGTRVSVEDSGA